MSDLYLTVKNLTRKKLRSVLTIFAIVIAFIIFGAVSALKGTLDSGIEMSADNRLVVVHKTNFTIPLPYSYINKTRNLPGVSQVTHANWFGGYYQHPSNQTVAFAVDPETYFKVYSELIIAPEQLEKWQKNQAGMLVGERMAENNRWKIGDRVPISSSIFSHKNGGHTWEFVIEGIFRAQEEQVDTGYLVFHYRYFMETHTFGGDFIGWMVLTTESPSLNEQVSKSIDAQFANSSSETQTSTEKAFNKAFIEQIGNIGLIIFGVVFMAFFTILVLVGNTMILAVRERTKEIAVLKTLGFNSTRIFKMTLTESLLLSFSGGLLGMAISYITLKAVSNLVARYLPNLIITPEIFLQSLGYMLLLGLVTGLIPALAALRVNIATAFSRG